LEVTEALKDFLKSGGVAPEAEFLLQGRDVLGEIRVEELALLAEGSLHLDGAVSVLNPSHDEWS
jgi:hypothetical protein